MHVRSDSKQRSTRYSLIVGMFYLGGALATAQGTQTPPCGANHTIPAGYGSCKEPNGTIMVGPPPAIRRATAVAAPPAETHVASPARSEPGVVVTHVPGIVAQPTKDTTQPQHPPSSSTFTSTWFTVAGITALAGLITAVAALIRAFRKD